MNDPDRLLRCPQRALRVFVVFALLGGAAACRPSEGDGNAAGTEWLGTITTDSDVTSVVNESGSVWGGTATLVEEASIGVDAGEEHDMLGRVASLAADDQRIYVLDTRPPVLRVYDFNGGHVMNIGTRGQGPGEFAFPSSLALMPDGRLMVRDDDNSRINFFSPDGTLLEDWALPGGFGTSRQSIVTPDGTVYSPQPIERNPQLSRSVWGMVPYGPDGKPGEPIRDPAPDPEFKDLRFPTTTTTTSSGRTATQGGGLVPFSPRARADYLNVGATVVATTDRYHFEVRYFDGRILTIERVVEPIHVSSDEAEWTRRYTTAVRRRSRPDWSWDAPGIPDTKPFFDYVVGDQSGRIWVARSGPGIRAEPCDEDPQPAPDIIRCWEDATIIDVFGPDGLYLGDVEPPPGFGLYDLRSSFIRGDVVVAPIEDEAGTITVKRYRLALPGDEGEE